MINKNFDFFLHFWFFIVITGTVENIDVTENAVMALFFIRIGKGP